MATTLRTSGITMGSSTTDVSGSAPGFVARSWINLKGTGTISTRGSGNVTSITDNGTGAYRVNFATAMAGANYFVGGITSGDGVAASMVYESNTGDNRASANTSSISVQVTTNAGTAADRANVNIAVFE